MDLTFYTSLLEDVKSRIRIAQTKATLAANAEMIFLYWDIGQLIFQRQQEQGWSAAEIPKLSKDLKNEQEANWALFQLGRTKAWRLEKAPKANQ